MLPEFLLTTPVTGTVSHAFVPMISIDRPISLQPVKAVVCNGRDYSTVDSVHSQALDGS